MSIEPSKQFGDYTLVEPLAQGSMGRVFLANHRSTNESVVVKVPLEDVPPQREALEREIRALGSLQHQSIVRLLDHGTSAGVPWLAQPRLEGETLRAALSKVYALGRELPPLKVRDAWATVRLEAPASPAAETEPAPISTQSRLTFDEVEQLADSLLDVLEHMHSKGIVHGDLKPENIIMVERGPPVVIDFGTSIRVDQARDDLLSAPRTVGTAAYMAPERLLSRGFDARADYYSLGCLLHEVMSGVSPFARPSVGATVLAQLRYQPPSLRSLNSKVPRKFSQIVARLLSKSADERPEFAGEIRDALRARAPSVRRPPAHNSILRRPELVGREGQLALLREKITAGRYGKGEHIRLVGPSGSGKTRLAILAADLADKAGFDVIEVSGDRVAELTPEALPELRERTRARPVLIVVDHLDALDATGLEFLRQLSSETLVDQSLLVLWSENPRFPLASEDVCDITLSPLSLKETARIAHDALGVDRLSTQVQGRLYDVSGGNPGHLLRYLRALIDEGVLIRRDYEGWHWSNATHPLLQSVSVEHTLRAAFESHLERLPSDVQEPARICAILGRAFHFAEFVRLSDLSESEATRALAVLIQEHVIESPSQDRFRFIHPEYHARLRSRGDPADSRAYHEKAARILEPLVDERPELTLSIAEHLFESGAWERAADYYEKAAGRYGGAHEREVAAEILSQARKALGRLQPSAEIRSRVRQLNERLGDLHLGLRRLDDAAASFELALDIKGEPAAAARVLRKLSHAHDRDKDRALSHLERAIELLRGPSEAGSRAQIEWIECHLAAMFIHYWRHETSRVLAIAEVVKSHVQEVGTPEQMASYHFNLAAALLLHHKYAARSDELEHIDKAVHLYDKVGDSPRVAMSRFMRSLILLCAGELEEADRGFSSILTAAEESASVTIQLRALTYLCLVARMKKEVERVRRMASSALSLAREHQMQEYAGTALANLAWVALCDGGQERCVHLAEKALGAWASAPVVSPFTWTARLPWLAAQLDQEGTLAQDTAAIIEWTAPLLSDTQQRPPAAVRTATEELVECALAPGADIEAKALELIEAAKRIGWL